MDYIKTFQKKTKNLDINCIKPNSTNQKKVNTKILIEPYLTSILNWGFIIESITCS